MPALPCCCAPCLPALLFAPLADVVELSAEDQIDIATAVAGSGPAYVHAFSRAMAEAGVQAGLSPDDAVRLARGAVRSAAAAESATSLYVSLFTV